MSGALGELETTVEGAFSTPLGRRALSSEDALVIVDLQNDFLPGGRLAVRHGDEVIPPLKRYIGEFLQRGLPIFITRDWHPKNHCSFTTQGGPWPVHCVQFTYGANFAEELKLPQSAILISKPGVADRESFCAFDGTDFEQQLRRLGVKRLFIGGLATDYCVLHTVLGALGLGFKVFLLCDAVRAVDVKPGDGDEAVRAMCARGAVPFAFSQISR